MSSPRSARETCRASSSSRAPAAPIRRRNVPTASRALPGDHAATPAHPPGGGQPDLAEPPREHRGLLGRDDELEMGPAAGQAERPAGEEPATQPGGSAVLGGGRPIERRGRLLIVPDRAAQPVDQPRDGRLAGAGIAAQSGRLGGPIARSSRVDRGQLVAERGDEVALGGRHVRRSGSRSGAASRCRPRRRA